MLYLYCSVKCYFLYTDIAQTDTNAVQTNNAVPKNNANTSNMLLSPLLINMFVFMFFCGWCT